MIQAVDGFSSREPMPSTGQNAENSRRRSTGKINEITAGQSVFGDSPLDVIERNDVYYALGMIDARAMALRRMLDVVRASRDIDDDVRGLLDVIGFEIAAIEDLADERMRGRAIQ